MKKLLPLFCSIALSGAQAQTVYLADTAFVTDVGFGGAPTSCKTNGMIYNGLNMDRTQGTWVADAFTVPAGATWIFDTVIVYGYQYGSTLTSPFMSGHMMLYNGIPGAGGTVIWGDTLTNILSSSAFTGIYKVDTIAANGGLMSTNRPIMYLKLYLSPAPRLSAGTYWLAWSAACFITTNSAVTPYQVLPGRLNPPGQVSRMYYSGSWFNATDNGQSIGLNFIIKGKAGLATVAEEEHSGIALLSQNTPNPASDETNISFTIPESGDVQLSVYNIMGQLVTTLANGYRSAGRHEATFRTGELPNGSYYYKLSTPTSTESRQMMIIR